MNVFLINVEVLFLNSRVAIVLFRIRITFNCQPTTIALAGEYDYLCNKTTNNETKNQLYTALLKALLINGDFCEK